MWVMTQHGASMASRHHGPAGCTAGCLAGRTFGERSTGGGPTVTNGDQRCGGEDWHPRKRNQVGNGTDGTLKIWRDEQINMGISASNMKIPLSLSRREVEASSSGIHPLNSTHCKFKGLYLLIRCPGYGLGNLQFGEHHLQISYRCMSLYECMGGPLPEIERCAQAAQALTICMGEMNFRGSVFYRLR